MTQFLPSNLLALFAPRDPIPYLPPIGKLPHEKKNKGYVGVADFMKFFERAEDTPPPKKAETREERLERRRRERAEQVAYKLEQEIAVWDPQTIPEATTDPFKTLFIARINYDTSESKLRREFELYGPIKKIVLVHDAINGKPRGYAFIEYEHERDMHAAYKHADGKKIDGRRVLVDVERGRTVKGWLPRRLGGGLGGTRRGGADVNLKHSGREDNEREKERYRLENEASERDRRNPTERDRNDRERKRSRSPRYEREKERRRRSRTPRSRSRERRRRDRVEVDGVDDRRDRERKRRRSHSRERDRKRDRREYDKDRDRDRKDNVWKEEKVRVKTEPTNDGYPSFNPSQPPPPSLTGNQYSDFGNYPVKKEEPPFSHPAYGTAGSMADPKTNGGNSNPPPPPPSY